MLFYVATVMPYTISFIDYGRFSVWYYIDIVVDVFFILDLFINFFYAYYDNDKKLVTNNKTLAKNYLKSWFIVDLVASFPLSLVLIEMESEK